MDKILIDRQAQMELLWPITSHVPGISSSGPTEEIKGDQGGRAGGDRGATSGGELNGYPGAVEAVD